MSYYLYDSNGYLGDLATITGLRELNQYLLKQNNKALSAFVNNGEIPLGKSFVEAIAELPLSGNRDIDNTITNLKSMVAKAQDIVIITDGVGNEFDPENDCPLE